MTVKYNRSYAKVTYCICCIFIGLFLLLIIDTKALAEDISPAVDMKQDIEIVINLEDESRFMGVDVYRIGEFDGEKYVYFTEYRKVVDKDYYALDTERQINTSISTIAEYIKEKGNIQADKKMKIIDGIGKAKGLPLGLYLIIQNEEDHNAELDNVIITETPLFDAEQNIYLYDIRLFPKWNRTIWFSFRPEVVYPLEIVLLLGICTCLCLFGVRLLRPLGLMSVFLISGLLGMKLGESVTKEFIWMMVFYTTFAFLGVGIIWILLATIGNIIKRMSLFEILRKQMCWLIPILAGLSGAYIIFTYVSNTWWFYVLIPMIVMLLGEVIQYRRKDKMKVFHTYEDLIKLSIVSEDRADGTVDSKLIAEGENNA